MKNTNKMQKLNWIYVKDREPKHFELCLIYLDKNNSFDEVGMIHHYVGRYKKDQCNMFNKGKPIPEFIESHFDTNGGTTYYIKVEKVLKYVILE